MFDSLIDTIVSASEKTPICLTCGPIRKNQTFKKGAPPVSVRVLCPHQKAEQEAAERADLEGRLAAQRRGSAVEAYRTKAPPPDQFAGLTIDGVEERAPSLAGLRAATRYLDTWPERLAAGEGLTLVGDIGTGKTMIAAAIANTIAQAGYSARFTTITQLQTMLKRWDEASDTMDDLKRCALLVIDDFGQERVTEWSSAQLFDLLDHRCGARRPTILTTNLGAAGLRAHYIRSLVTGKAAMPDEQAALTVDRVLSRIRQRNIGISFAGPDQRVGAVHAWLTED